jgi:hypothetical protein
MLTFSQISSRALDIVGNPQDGNVTSNNIQQDINQGLKLFKNAARRYWTRKQIVANLVSGQQDYQLPADFVRVTQVTITANGIVYPLVEVPSEYKWNELNIIPSVTIYIPTRYFVKGFNVISVWPAPSTANIGTLNVSYEPRLVDWNGVADTTGTCTVTNGSTTVTDSATNFAQQMIGQWFSVTDGTDGNWYQIGAYDNNASIELANYYQGISGSGRSYRIGIAPDIPEDYHMAFVYYPAYQFYLKRGDIEQAEAYLAMFNALLDQYIETYSSKTTGVVQTKQRGAAYNIFGLPPTNITG